MMTIIAQPSQSLTDVSDRSAVHNTSWIQDDLLKHDSSSSFSHLHKIRCVSGGGGGLGEGPQGCTQVVQAPGQVASSLSPRVITNPYPYRLDKWRSLGTG